MANYKARETLDLTTANFTSIRYEEFACNNVYGDTDYRLSLVYTVKIKAARFLAMLNENRHSYTFNNNNKRRTGRGVGILYRGEIEETKKIVRV